MSAPWLERLSHTTDYRELQVLFAEIAAEARATEDPRGLARLIDEAILRIERERHRDEDEVRAFEKEYEAFKEKESGVVGWLKRHVPFTETRRQAKEHQAAVSDQEAEVLADNLIIARAQMLKEALLPLKERRLGREPSAWRQQLAARDAITHVRDYGVTLTALGRELARGREFVKQLDTDIDAFAKARFAADEDRQRQKDDLAAARGELAACRAELEDEAGIRAQGVAHARELVIAELAEGDASFARLATRLDRVDDAEERAASLEKDLLALQSELKAARELATKIEALPERREEIARQVATLGHDADDAERARLQASTGLAENAARAQHALDALTRAQAAVDAAKRAWDAHVVESGQVELPPDTTIESSSPQAAAHARAEQELEAARAAHRVAQAAHAQAEAETDRAEETTAAARKGRAEARETSDALVREERRLEGELDTALGALRPMLDRLPRDMGAFRSALDRLDRRQALRDVVVDLLPRRRFAVEGMGQRTGHDLSEASARCADLLVAIQQEGTAIAEEGEADRKARDAALARRCRDLLGEELGREVCSPTA